MPQKAWTWLFVISVISLCAVHRVAGQDSDSSDETATTEGDNAFTVPQKAFGMGLVNGDADVVAAALQRAVEKDRPLLIQRGLVFYTLIKRKRGEGINEEGVAGLVSEAVEILVTRGYDRSRVEGVIFEA